MNRPGIGSPPFSTPETAARIAARLRLSPSLERGPDLGRRGEGLCGDQKGARALDGLRHFG